MMRRDLFLLWTVVITALVCQFFQPVTDATSTPITKITGALKIEIRDATTIYYEIKGSTANELRQEMNKRRPVNEGDGLRYDARTDWFISWTWPGYGKSECDLSQASVSYDINVTVPYWKPSADIDPALIAHWNQYMNALAVHEQVHVSLILDHYLDVKDAIQGSTCETAEQAAQDVLDEIRRLHDQYDQQTRHGETQGAVFP